MCSNIGIYLYLILQFKVIGDPDRIIYTQMEYGTGRNFLHNIFDGPYIGINEIQVYHRFSIFFDCVVISQIILLPIILFVAVFEKQIMDGIMAGGVKA